MIVVAIVACWRRWRLRVRKYLLNAKTAEARNAVGSNG